MGVNRGHVAHTGWGRCGVLGYAQEERGNAVRTIVYYSNDGRGHEEPGRVIATWCARGASAIWQVIGTPVTDLEAAQGHQAAADKRPSRVQGVAQALRQQPPACGAARARWAYAPGARTIGHRVWPRAPRAEGSKPAADVALSQLDLLRRAGDHCRQ